MTLEAGVRRRCERRPASFLGQPRLADAFEQGRQMRRMVGQPLDGEVGIEAASFRQRGFRLVRLA
jgi:hypothetical protein